jgi:hypothetical protein
MDIPIVILTAIIENKVKFAAIISWMGEFA